MSKQQQKKKKKKQKKKKKKNLWELDVVGIFSAIFFKADNLCGFLFAFSRTKFLLESVNTKMKEFAPFPVKIGSFSEARKNKFDSWDPWRCIHLGASSFPFIRKQAYSNMLKILPPKNENFQIKNLILFIFLLKK